MTINTCTQFLENILTVLKLYSSTLTFEKNQQKKRNSVINIGGVTVLFLCISSDDGLYLLEVS